MRASDPTHDAVSSDLGAVAHKENITPPISVFEDVPSSRPPPRKGSVALRFSRAALPDDLRSPNAIKVRKAVKAELLRRGVRLPRSPAP
jgi:hypothetical protein